MNWKTPLFKIYWENDDIQSITNVIKRGNYWTTGPEIEQLENKTAKYIGKKHAIAFNSGTSALHAALLAHDITNGEVIVPSFTFISTANTVILAGARPVFAEIEDETYGLDPEDVKNKITKKTKAIIPVHIAGGVCKEIKALREIADDHKIIMIEDAAESLGAHLNKKMVGNYGQTSIFSFCQNKIITSGEGGITLTDNKNVYNKLKLIRSHGRVEQENFFSTTKDLDYIQIGYNYRMSSLTAALVLSQMKKINKIIKIRKNKAQYYNQKLSKNKNVKTPTELKNSKHVYQMYTIQLKNKQTRDKIQQKLTREKILTKIYFNPIHLKTYYRQKHGYKKGDLPKTEKISGKVLTLPLYPTLKKTEINNITKIINKMC